jgi:UDP-glucuronate 4-epimerase
MKILVTGGAGFIGSHTSHALLERGHDVLGIDNLNDYYDPALKQARLAELTPKPGYAFEQMDIADDQALLARVKAYAPDRIVHLAAQAGVRYSLENPMAYARSNLIGHLAVLEAVRHTPSVKHLVYASSSSVYGERNDAPFSEDDPVENPVSLYAATKRADELMSATYSRLYGLTQTGLRFFTVYGRWGRPDMAYWLFTDAILKGEPIKVFNKGEMQRDFTYIEDVVRTVVKIAEDTPDAARHRVYNIGGSDPRPLKDFIAAIEAALGMEAEKIYLPMQKGDVTKTSADVSAITRDYGYAATTSIEDGIRIFVDWYRDFYSV